MVQDPEQDGGDPWEFIDLVRRHRLLIALCAIFGAGLAFAYSSLQPRVFQSSAVMIFRTVGGDGMVRDGSAGSSLTATASAQVELRFFQSTAVQDAAATKLDGEADVEALILEEAVGLEVVARAASADLAATAANVYAQTYTKERVLARSRDAVAAQGVLQSQIGEVDTELGDLQVKLNNIAAGTPAGEGEDAERLTAEFTTLTAKKLALQQRLDSMLLVGAGDGPEIVSPAEPNDDPVAPAPVRNGIAGAFGGICVGVALMLLRERLDGVVRSDKALGRELVDVPILAVIPHIGRRRGDDAFLTIKREECITMVEPLRALRSAIQFSAKRSAVRSVLVLSPDPGEGKSTIAFNLALTMGRAGSTAILVDGDVRRPTISRSVLGSSDAGLTTVVSGVSGLHESVVRVEGEPNVAVLPAGPKEGWTGLVESHETRSTVEWFGGLADFVVFDAPPVLASADALTLCRMVDAVVLVVRVGRTREAAVEKALMQLRQVDAPLLGVVVNDMKRSRLNRYHYYEYYSYAPSDEAPILGRIAAPNGAVAGSVPDVSTAS